MPTYEYECTKCDHSFERFQNMTDKPLQRCPLCRCKVKRIFGTGAGIIFKGSGFYATDYRSPAYATAAKKEKDVTTAASSGKKETGKSPESSKTAAKSGDA